MPERLSERALARRLKRQLMKAPQRWMAVGAPGFEDVLAAEVAALPDVGERRITSGGVEFTAPLDTVYHANLQLRSAHRVLLRLKTFLAQSYPMLFDRARKLPWELYLGFNPNLAIRVSAKRSRLRHHKNLAATVHDAIYQALEPLGLRPALTPHATSEIHLRLFEDRCTLSLNTSGSHLHKRGYRKAVGSAPLRETLAAATLLSLPLGRYGLVWDPMCGSGTLLIEAALLARGAPPGAARAFAFEQLPFFQASKWQRFKREALAASQAKSPLALLGSDSDASMIDAASANAERAGVLRELALHCQDALEHPYPELPQDQRGLIVCNPPYGKRLADNKAARALYQALLARWRPCAEGWDIALLAPDAPWLRPTLTDVGLEPSRRFRHGGLATCLFTHLRP